MNIEQHIINILNGKATEAELQEVWQWLAEREEHVRRYEEICRAYYKLQYSAKWKNIQGESALQKIRAEAGRIIAFRKWSYRMAGIAALVLLCLGGGLLLFRTNEANLPVAGVTREVYSGERKAQLTLADGQVVALSAGKQVDVDLGFARAVEDSLGLVYQLNDSVVAPREFHTLSVPRAGEYIMVLSDGSRVWLNSETEMKYPVRFEADKREVYIIGEAFFEVVKDPARPFIVRTPHTRTTVLGTSFNVMAYRDIPQTEITLVSGKVEVGAGEQSCCILPGQQVEVDHQSLRMESREVNVSFYTSWREGLFDFDHMRLEDLCMQLSRWYDADFFFVHPDAAEKRFTGAVKRNNSLRFMLDFVEKTSNVRFEVNGKTVSVYNL